MEVRWHGSSVVKLTHRDSTGRRRLEANRQGDCPEVRTRLDQVVDRALDRRHLRELLEEWAWPARGAETCSVRRS